MGCTNRVGIIVYHHCSVYTEIFVRCVSCVISINVIERKAGKNKTQFYMKICLLLFLRPIDSVSCHENRISPQYSHPLRTEWSYEYGLAHSWSYLLLLIRGKQFVPSICSSLLSLNMVKSFVPKKWHAIWSRHLSLKESKLFVPQYGQPICPSKWASHLSLNIVKLFAPQ